MRERLPPFCISNFQSWLQAQTSCLGCWRQRWHEQELIWSAASKAKDTQSMEKCQWLKPDLHVAHTKVNCSNARCCGWRGAFLKYTCEPGWKCDCLALDLCLSLKWWVEGRDEAGTEPCEQEHNCACLPQGAYADNSTEHKPVTGELKHSPVALLCSSGVWRTLRCFSFKINGPYKIGSVKAKRLFYSHDVRWCHKWATGSEAPGESQCGICRQVPVRERGRWWELDLCFCFIGMEE